MDEVLKEVITHAKKLYLQFRGLPAHYIYELPDKVVGSCMIQPEIYVGRTQTEQETLALIFGYLSAEKLAKEEPGLNKIRPTRVILASEVLYKKRGTTEKINAVLIIVGTVADHQHYGILIPTIVMGDKTVDLGPAQQLGNAVDPTMISMFMSGWDTFCNPDPLIVANIKECANVMGLDMYNPDNPADNIPNYLEIEPT